ncbi:MAG: kinase/pyrophosphorylase [Alphaproteobacteria bacterium]|jgi:regulator of PEP synthase PpsR (kinase-PPPase family)|nr:kinase/pyrophosphorylase [Alphaproteobacteria bacterium]
MNDATLHIHLVSDSTGETVHQITRACVAQFSNVRTTEHVWTLVRSHNHVDAVFAGVDRNPGVLLMSVVDEDLRAEFERRCTERGIPHVSVLDPVVDLLGRILGKPMRNRPGGQRQLDTAYFDRMAAVDFAVRHDDGLNMAELHDADILLVGVSRTSKTPTSMYLAHRGYKVANYALVPGVPFPAHYIDRLKLFVVGLTNDPKRLSVVRKTRQIAQSDESNVTYTDLERITEEVRDARRLFARNQWPVIDVTRRSVEETAAAVIQLHTNWQEENS